LPERGADPLDDLVDRSSPTDAVPARASWRRSRPRWSRVAIGVFTVLALYYLFSLVQVVQAGRADDRDQVDAIVVLGAAQYDGRPSAQLRARLDHAVTLWEADVAPVVMVTGGKQPDDRFTEAEASRRYLVDRGVPSEVIMMEDIGRSTYESLESAAPMLLAAEANDVVLVSDAFHMKRSELIASGFGLDARVSATPSSVVSGWTSVRRHLREAAGVALGRVVGFERLSELSS
jgi:uncharacterized SAM-binding protein YcdF (DUF218 family)